MEKEPRRFKKLVSMFSVLLLFLLLSALTNPTKAEFIKFDKTETGITIPDTVQIAEANFFFFSIYAPMPKNTIEEFGIVHLGFMGHFFKVTDGQYDDSIWEDFLGNKYL
jgi:hypothetical protein